MPVEPITIGAQYGTPKSLMTKRQEKSMHNPSTIQLILDQTYLA